MKSYKRILAFILGVITLGFASSCANTLEELSDLDLSRCLQPMNLTAKVNQGQIVTFSWDVTKDADYYLLEVYKDAELTSLSFSENVEPENVPFTKSLDVDSEFWFRVRALNADREDSKWAVYEKSIKTYAVKSNLFMEVSAREATSMSFAWTADPEVDRIEYCVTGSEETAAYTLTEADIQNGTATVNGLTPSTEYDFILYFSSANRGEVVAWTMPDATNLTEVTTSAALIQGIKDGAKILLSMDGSPYTISDGDIAKGLDVAKGFEIHGAGTPDGGKPVIYGTFSIVDTYEGGDILVEGVEMNGQDNTCGFLIQHKEGSTADNVAVGNITFLNCDIAKYSKGLFYEWGKTLVIGDFTFDSCYIHEINADGSGGGDGIDIRNATSISTLSVVNNTITNGFRTFLRIDPNVLISNVVFDNNTLVNLSFVDNTNNAGIIGFQMIPQSFSFKNNLFLAMTGKSRLTSENTKYKTGDELNLSAANNYFYFVEEEMKTAFFTSIFTLGQASGKVLADDPCYNIKASLYNIVSTSDISGAQVGASKWWAEYVEAPEDLTMEILDGPHTWDFNDGAYFSSDFTKSKVRDGLLFGVINNKITLTEGIIGFTAPATTNRTGLPTDGYMAFLVDKPGSVYIKAVNVNEKFGNHIVIGKSDINGNGFSVKGGAAANTDNDTPTKVLIKDIAEPSLIYVYPTGVVGIEQLAWATDTTQVNTALAAPSPEAKPASVTAGEPKEILVSWDPVENAASYSVEFRGKTYAVEQTSYAIAESVVGMLDPGSYKVQVYANPGKNDIYNTMSEAGVATFAVQPAGGSAGSTEFVVSSVDELMNAIDAGKQSITLKYSDTPYQIGSYTVTTPLNLYGQTEGDNKTPIVASFTISGEIGGSFTLNNLDITNETLSVIIEDKNNAPVADTVAIVGCNIHGTKALYDNSGKATSCVQVLRFRDNIVSGCSTGADFIDMRAGEHHTVSIVNNTFANSCRTFIRTDAGHELNYLTVRNNTFYKVATNSESKDNNGIFHVRSVAGSGLLEYKVLNNIFYSILIDETPGNANGYPKFRSGSGIDPMTIANNYFYNCEDREDKADYSFWKNFTKEAATVGGGAILPADPFKDAENGDFTLINGVAMNANVGDPRWNPVRGGSPTSEITVKSTDEFLTAISAGKTTITLAAGQYDLTAAAPEAGVEEGKVAISQSLNIIGENGAELIGGFKFKVGVKDFTAKNVTFNGNSSVDNVFEVSESGAELNKVSINGCCLKNYKNRLFYMNVDANQKVASLEFDKCILTGTTGAEFTGGDFIDIRKGTVNAIRFHNCTVYNAVRTFLRADAASVVNSVLVSNNTFYNLCYVDSKDNNGLFHVRSTALAESAYVVKNNIFAGMHRAAETPSNANGYPKLVSTNTASLIPAFSHNYFYDIDALSDYNFWTKDRVTEEVATAGYGIVLTESPFKDAANGDFTLTSALAASEKVGDSRWNSNAVWTSGSTFEVATTEELLIAIDAGKTNITLSGEVYDLTSVENAAISSGVLSVVNDLVLTGKLSHGVKPEVFGGFKCLSTDGGLVLNNISLIGTKEIDGNNMTIGNLVEIDAAAILSKITIKDCDIKSYGNRLVSGAGESTCGPLLIMNNYVTDFGTSGDFIDFRKGKVSSIKVVNNTFANGIRTFLRADAAVVCGAVTVENNTFYNIGSVDSKDNNGIMHVRSTTATSNPRQIVVKKNIFASMHRAVETPANTSNGFPHLISKTSAAIAVPTIADNIYFDIDDVENYGWWMFLPEGSDSIKSVVVTETPFAADPTTGKFTVKSEYKGYGDIRW